MSVSYYIIKPEGMEHRIKIRQLMRQAGLSIPHSFMAKLPEWVAAQLYPDLAEEKGVLWQATCQHLVGHACEFGMVQGKDAVEVLLSLSGRHTSPPECGPLSIRRMWGNRVPIECGEGKRLWRNVIHRPKNEDEVERDREIFCALQREGSI